MNNIKIKSGLTASDLKYLAIMAMLIDHVAYLFVPHSTMIYFCMRFVGRITAPVMCFFISEGYHHTRNLNKYFQRMAVFAVISHFAFAFCFNTHTESMITTLFLSLLAVHMVNKGKKEFILPAVLIICCLANFCDWGIEAVIYTLIFEITHENRKKQLLTYGITAGIIRIIQIFMYKNWYSLGVFIPIPLLLMYNGKKGGGKYTKWVFYVFYPLHLFLLGAINYEFFSNKI